MPNHFSAVVCGLLCTRACNRAAHKLLHTARCLTTQRLLFSAHTIQTWKTCIFSVLWLSCSCRSAAAAGPGTQTSTTTAHKPAHRQGHAAVYVHPCPRSPNASNPDKHNSSTRLHAGASTVNYGGTCRRSMQACDVQKVLQHGSNNSPQRSTHLGSVHLGPVQHSATGSSKPCLTPFKRTP